MLIKNTLIINQRNISPPNQSHINVEISLTLNFMDYYYSAQCVHIKLYTSVYKNKLDEIISRYTHSQEQVLVVGITQA